jgi:hypothetical protein
MSNAARRMPPPRQAVLIRRKQATSSHSRTEPQCGQRAGTGTAPV